MTDSGKKDIWSLYKITNRVNQRFYIGVHKEDNYPKTDNYMGRSVIVDQAIKKYGLENLHREILVYGCGKYCYDLERKIVDENFVNHADTYNICGGEKGSSYRSADTKKKISKAMKGKPKSKETRKKIAEAHKGKKASVESKKKMSKAHKARWTDSMRKEHSERMKKLRKKRKETEDWDYET